MKLFTIGYIDYDQEVYDRLLGPSIENLKGEFDIIKIKSGDGYPTSIYNRIIEKSNTPYIILTHQDVSFSSNLLDRIEMTINLLNGKFGAIGLVGVDKQRNYKWSVIDKIYELDTIDGCFIVVKKENGAIFDEILFNDYHLYTEDYCANLSRNLNQKIYTILVKSIEANPYMHYNEIKGDIFLNHHSNTIAKRGTAWGRYYEYRLILEKKWPGIKTT